MCMLKGLSDENSWDLFVLTAFERESDEVNDPELTKIGRNIVKKCSNVPLAIKVLGTLLYGQTQRWKSFEENRLPQIETNKNPIVSILKLSYNNLESSVKSCFRYCAMFPKDFVMNKQKLISLWMAQGYIDDGEDCFLILLKRCFFQDVKKDMLGDVESFKMHDLIHDLAQEVAGDEFIVADNRSNNISKTNRHVFIDGWKWTKTPFQEINIRTCYMSTEVDSGMVKTLVSNWRCLRSLCLYLPHAKHLPESVSELLHLRYLDLSDNEYLEALPESIVKLYNLQSLILKSCKRLKEWPKYFYKLVNLRLLDICACHRLRCMPLGIGKLTTLCHLTDFKVSSSGKQFVGQLEDLKWLVNLRGGLNIWIHKENNASEKETIVWEECFLEHIKNLKEVYLYYCYSADETNYNAVVGQLLPNPNIMELRLSGFDFWSRLIRNVPNLVRIELYDIERLEVLPLLSHLKHLKSLRLDELNRLEYMESSSSAISNGRTSTTVSMGLPFYATLEVLFIRRLKRLKGWWKGMPLWEQPPFPRLSKLVIEECPELTSFPPCSILESLGVTKSNKSLRIFIPGEGDLALRVECIDSLVYLTTLPARRLTQISICWDNELETNLEIDEVLKSCSSLRSLEIGWCERASVSGVLKHLTALESLSLTNISALVDDNDDDDDDDMPWRSLRHNLSSLKLDSLRTLQILPTGMKHLTALQNLDIVSCKSLKGLPEWISCLSSLHSLTIQSCYSLKSLGTI